MKRDRDTGSADDFKRLKSEISTIIDAGRDRGIKSESIVEAFFNQVAVDDEIVIEEDTREQRPLTMREIILIARKAIEQAEFEGAFAVLPSGEKIKKRVHGTPQWSGG